VAGRLVSENHPKLVANGPARFHAVVRPHWPDFAATKRFILALSGQEPDLTSNFISIPNPEPV